MWDTWAAPHLVKFAPADFLDLGSHFRELVRDIRMLYERVAMVGSCRAVRHDSMRVLFELHVQFGE